MTTATNSGKLKLTVTPYPQAIPPNPQVIVNNTKPKGQAKIRWKFASGYNDYKMYALLQDDGVFKNVEIKDNKITCDYEPPTEPKAEYPYTLVIVNSDGIEFTTTEQDAGPNGGKPVIRN